MIKPPLLAVAGLVCLVGLPTCHAQTITATLPTGSSPAGIAINSITNKIYVTNLVAGTVTVIDGATNATTTVPAGSGPVWAAVNPLTNKIYIANEYGGTVTVIDGDTNATTNLVTNTYSLKIEVNPITNKIYVSDEFASTVSVIDGDTNNVTTISAIGLFPEGLSVNPLTNKIYVPNEFGTAVTVIDGATNNTVILPVSSGSSPQASAVNPVTNKVYVAGRNGNSVTVIDGATNNLITVPAGVDAFAVAVNPITNEIYVANRGSSTVTVIDGATNKTTTINVGPTPVWVALNAVTNKVYVLNDYGGITVIDGATNATQTLATGQGPDAAVAVNPVTNKIYVANENGNSVAVIDGATNTITTITAGTGPASVGVNPVTNKIYVPNEFSNNVSVIDGATSNATTVPAGANPIAVAVNPVTNTIYVADRSGSDVTVIDGVTNTPSYVTAGLNPVSVAANPVTNKIYVANSGAGSVTVIDGATKNTTAVPTGTGPWSVAVNPVTNKIYVANQFSNNATVIDGATNGTATVPVGSTPVSVAVNSVTNKIYVANNGGGLTVIDGDTNHPISVPTGTGPNSVAVNPITNKIYVANTVSSTVTVVDGVTNATTNVPVGANPIFVAVNQATNKIYVADQGAASVTVIDGATNATSTVAAGSNPVAIAVNLATNQTYVANIQGNSVTKITEQQAASVPLTASIVPLPGNATAASTQTFNFNAASAFSPIPTIPDAVYYQVDTLQGRWAIADGSSPSFSGTVGPLQQGFHILYAFAGDTQEGNTTQAGGRLISNIQAYGFLSGSSMDSGPLLPPPTVTFTGAPAQAAYNATFNVAATTNASTTPTITASGACSILGIIVTMTSGTGTCSLKASWAADANYSAATANQFTTATKIAPTTTFTGAPASSVYQSTFPVAATTNASVTAVITVAGQCSISGTTVKITSGTGACALTANWAADTNYVAAIATQSTAAAKATPTLTFTGAPASAPYYTSFTVASTTNTTTTAAITSGGSCSNSSNIVTMSGLPGTCALTASWPADDNYNSAIVGQSTLAVAAPPVPPRISNVTATGITITSATISWTTDQGSSSQVQYGTDLTYGSFSSLDSNLLISHSITLTALAPGIIYDYAVISVGPGGPVTSTNFTFATPGALSVTAITPIGGAANNTGGDNGPTSLMIPYNSGTGNTIVATCALGNVSSAINSITDAGSSWSLRAFAVNGNAVRSEIWSTGPGVSVASSSFKISLTGPSSASCALEEYAGVLSIGTTATSQAVSGTPSVSLTTDDPNDFVVAGLGANSYYGYLSTAGTIRQKGAVTSGAAHVQMALCDNTATTATSVTCSSISGSAPWAATALELRAGSGGQAAAPVISSVAFSNLTSTSVTITWTTDQASNSQVKYGTTISYGSFSSLKSTLTTAHSVNLTTLTPGTAYNYAVISASSGGTTTSANFTFSTPASIPAISAVSSSGVTNTSATIAWTTDQPASSQLEYGTTPGYGSFSPPNSALTTSHSVTLSPLTPGQVYNYAVISATSAGPATSGNFTFSTPSASIPHVIAAVGGAHNNTGSNASPSSLSLSYASSSGNTIVAVCALGGTSSSISSITDNGSVWTFQATVNNGTAVRSEIWSTTAGGSVASSTFTINISGPTPASCALEEYSGVLNLGTTATGADTSGTISVSLTPPEANDFVVAGLGANSYNGYTITNGTLRQAGGLTQNSGKNYVEMVLCDNTAATTGPITCSSVSGPAAWAAPALLLR